MKIDSQNIKCPCIFISCSNKDEDEEGRDNLLLHLQVYVNKKELKVFSRKDISLGRNVIEELKDLLSKVDAIVALLSAEYISSEELTEGNEYPLILDCIKNKKTVIPILWAPCQFTGTVFKKLELLPRNKKFVSSYENKEEILTGIVNELVKQIINRDAHPVKTNAREADVTEEQISNAEPMQIESDFESSILNTMKSCAQELTEARKQMSTLKTSSHDFELDLMKLLEEVNQTCEVLQVTLSISSGYKPVLNAIEVVQFERNKALGALRKATTMEQYNNVKRINIRNLQIKLEQLEKRLNPNMYIGLPRHNY